MKYSIIFITSLLTLLLVTSSMAMPRHRAIADINKSPYRDISKGVLVGDDLYFIYRHPRFGKELFKLDISSRSQTLVKDIFPGASEPSDSFTSRNLATVNGKVFFVADDGVHGSELWVSDGTSDGTFMLKDIFVGAGSSAIDAIVSAGGRVYFAAESADQGYELWYSDGTPGGTASFDINPGIDSSSPDHLTVIGDKIYFTAYDPALGNEVHILDVNTNTYSLLKDINPGSESNHSSEAFIPAFGSVFFAANDVTNGVELWKTDGTEAGTQMVKDISPGAANSYPEGITLVGNFLYFTVYTSFGQPHEIWRSDGTEAGTTFVQTLVNGGFDSSSGEIHYAGINSNYLFKFRLGEASGPELYKSDGSPNGFGIVKELGSNLNLGFDQFLGELTVNGVQKQIFIGQSDAHGIELWATDGSAAGTSIVRNILLGRSSSDPIFLAKDSSYIYFLATYRTKGGELRLGIYRTNGTKAGTVLLARLPHGDFTDGHFFSNSEVIGRKMYFEAATPKAGSELWVTNGTAAGTKLVKNIANGHFHSYPNQFMKFGKKLFFSAFDSGGAAHEPFISNGTGKGTFRLGDINPGETSSHPRPFGQIGNVLLFSADGTGGRELYRTDGTVAGTVLVKDIAVGSEDGIDVHQGVIFNEKLFFQAGDAVNGYELYVSDGTEAGTMLLKNIDGATSSQPREFALFANGFLFSAVSAGEGRELYFSDGTEAGTVQIKDIRLGGSSSFPSDITTAGNKAFFTAFNDATGTELWITDGTSVGTAMVKDIKPGVSGSSPDRMHAIGSRIVFSVFEEDFKRSVWGSDGTEAGTVKLYDASTLGGTLSTDFASKNGIAYFGVNASDGTVQIWRTDGTALGTSIFSTLSSGVPGIDADCDVIEVVRNQLFVLYSFGRKGKELFKIKLSK